MGGTWSRSFAAWSSQLPSMMWVIFEQEMLRLGWNRIHTRCCISQWGKGNLTMALTQPGSHTGFALRETQHSDLVMFEEDLTLILLSLWEQKTF